MNTDSDYHPPQNNHWENYKLYYLIFGSFFLTTLIILISNSNTNKEFRNLKEQLAIKEQQKQQNNNFLENQYNSEFVKPNLAQKNENWINDNIIKENVRKEVEIWINSFKYLPEYFAKEGPEIDKHVLLSGPPGTGKTHLALTFCQNEALQYALVKFDTVLLKGSSIAKQEKALEQAKNILRLEEERQKKIGIKEKIKPVVIIIDELDSVGIKDLSPNNSASRDEVNGLLRMIDEINNKKLNIILIGITNYPETLDPALTRPGRLGRKIEIGYPTEEEMDKLMDYLEKEVKSERGYKFFNNKNKWSSERDDEKMIINWPNDFWLDIRRITKEIIAKYSAEKINTSFTLRDLEKLIGGCLATKSGKNVQEITPNSQDYQGEIEKEMQKRIKDEVTTNLTSPQTLLSVKNKDKEN